MKSHVRSRFRNFLWFVFIPAIVHRTWYISVTGFVIVEGNVQDALRLSNISFSNYKIRLTKPYVSSHEVKETPVK